MKCFAITWCLITVCRAVQICVMQALPYAQPDCMARKVCSFQMSSPDRSGACVQTKHAADEGTQEWLRSVMSVDAPGARRPSPLRSATTAPAALASALRPPYASSPEPVVASQAPAESAGGGSASVADPEQAQELLAAESLRSSLRSLEQEDLEGLRGTLGGSGSKTGTGGGDNVGAGGEAGGSRDMDSGSGHVQAWHMPCIAQSHKHSR